MCSSNRRLLTLKMQRTERIGMERNRESLDCCFLCRAAEESHSTAGQTDGLPDGPSPAPREQEEELKEQEAEDKPQETQVPGCKQS